MDLTTVTVAQFKAQFYRDFPYMPTYDPTAIYNSGDVVYYPNTTQFYQAQVDGLHGVAPVLQYDKGYKYDTEGNKYDSNRKYWVPYKANLYDFIQDQDITNAFQEALIVVNHALFGSDAQVTLGFLYMTAHFLCNDINAARGGVNSTGRFPVAGRTVGSVSETYSIPAQYTDNPILAQYTQTAYGMKYLALVMPLMVGNMAAVRGGTNP